ncbi:hypothetical protein Q9L58_009941, partial [Maublancomyces gigas]
MAQDLKFLSDQRSANGNLHVETNPATSQRMSLNTTSRSVSPWTNSTSKEPTSTPITICP